MIAANKAIRLLLAEVDAALLEPPVNVLRLSLHPRGLANQIVNYSEWRTHLLERLRGEIKITVDGFLLELTNELQGFPAPAAAETRHRRDDDFADSRIAVPLRLSTAAGELSFISTTTVFGTPLEVTLAELAIESFFPADAATMDAMERMSR